MSEAYMTEARAMANELVLRESRGSGDTENAMRRLESRLGIPWRTFWSLRYRPPKDILMGTYIGLRNAYHAECERQMRRLQHEVQIAKAKGVDAPAVAQAERFLSELSGEG